MELTKHSPLTKQQALAICQEYQHLVGASFDPTTPGKGKIICITAAPYDEARQWQFAQFYRECNDPERALSFYKGNAYIPVVLAIPVIRKRSIVYQDLRDYLRANDIPLTITHQRVPIYSL